MIEFDERIIYLTTCSHGKAEAVDIEGLLYKV
jgi:hypothetical protein